MSEWFTIGLQTGKNVSKKVNEFIESKDAKENFKIDSKKELRDGTTIYRWYAVWAPWNYKVEKTLIDLLTTFKGSDNEDDAFKLIAVGDDGGHDSMCNDLGIDSYVLYLREKLLANSITAYISEFLVEDQIAVCAELIDLLLNTQVNIINGRPRDYIVKKQRAYKIKNRDKIVFHVKYTPYRIDQYYAQQRTGIDHHDPEGCIPLSKISQDRKERCQSNFNRQYDVPDVVDRTGHLNKHCRIAGYELD